MSQSAVSLREERSVTDVLNATFLFIRQNIRIYGKMLVLLITPVFGVGLILATIVTTTVDFSGQTDVTGAKAISLGLTGFLFFLLLILASLAIYTGALTIVRLYDERGPENFDLEDVWTVGKSKLLGFVGIGFLLGLILVLPILLFIWIPCLNVIAMFGWFMYVFGTFGLAYAAYVMEDCSVGSSLSRSKELAENYFWPTIGLYLLTTLIVTVIGSIAQLPFQILAFSEGFFTESPELSSESAVFMAISYVVAILVSTFLGLIPQVAMTFQYTNLVERKENVGLQRRVEQIGDAADGDAPLDSTPRMDPERADIDYNDTDVSPTDRFAPNDLAAGPGEEASEHGTEGPAGDENGDGTRWEPPQRTRGEGESDDGHQEQGEPDDSDDRWRPPTS